MPNSEAYTPPIPTGGRTPVAQADSDPTKHTLEDALLTMDHPQALNNQLPLINSICSQFIYIQ